MFHEFRCKRIIDGKTYNTETATLIGQWESIDSPIEEALFKTRHGAYFLYCDSVNSPYEWIKPLDPDDARKWVAERCPASVWESEFGEAPEAGDSEARLTLRIPEVLHRRIAICADSQKQSLNAWILRCLERCAMALSEQEG